jgi:hypothetical protein
LQEGSISRVYWRNGKYILVAPAYPSTGGLRVPFGVGSDDPCAKLLAVLALVNELVPEDLAVSAVEVTFSASSPNLRLLGLSLIGSGFARSFAGGFPRATLLPPAPTALNKDAPAVRPYEGVPVAWLSALGVAL